MAAKNVILALLALTSFAYGQTRALFVNTNGTVQWGTTLRFDGPLDFTTNGFAATTRSNLSLGLPALTNDSNAGLLSALGGLATNGSAAGLTNFPALLLTTNSAASAFPTALLRTNGDGSGLTNLPNANLSNAVGVLPLSNGGTGATNASAARTALQLGTAATNDATAFQPASSALTNLATNNAINLTNFPADLLRTNGDASGLTGLAVFPSYTNNAQKVLAVTTNESGVEWVPVSNTVTDAALLTNFPAFLLQTNGNAAGLSNFPSLLLRTNGSAGALTNFPAELLRTNGNAAALTNFPANLLRTDGDAFLLSNFPTLNQNTTGTADNVTGIVAVANGGTGAADVTNARVNLLPSYTGNANKVLAINSGGTDLAWVDDQGGVVNLTNTNVTGVLPISKGGTGGTNNTNALINFAILSNNSSVKLPPGNTASGSAAIAIGYLSIASAQGAIALGYDVDATAIDAVAIGWQAGATSFRSTALGRGAIAGGSGTNTVQIGEGSNSTANSVQFLSAGAVNTTEWGYLANASTKGGSRMTNTNGVTVTNTIVGYNGTNYTTNTITVIDGIITSWTQ